MSVSACVRIRGCAARRGLGVVVATAVSLVALRGHALDKQGSAHGGSVAGAASGFGIDGALSGGLALYNPSFAARPDNTGLSFARYALHVDVDLIGRRLSIPLDVNVVTDRTRDGGKKLLPSELDLIGGLTSTWAIGPTAIEVGSRFQHERPVDRGTFAQTFVDARARWLLSLAGAVPSVSSSLGGGDLSGWLTLGWFAINRTYVARPDNTGLALFRYAAHARLSFWQDRLAIGLDATFFTDRNSDRRFRPSELDLTPELIVRAEPFEVHLAYERDMPLDRGSFVQQFVYLLAVWEFSLFEAKREPLEDRNNVVSP